jgi:hypothetical protein
MTKAKTKRFDCVEAKRRAQRGLTKALAGHTPAEQVEILRRLAEESPFWKKLRAAKTKPPAKAKPAVSRKKSA